MEMDKKYLKEAFTLKDNLMRKVIKFVFIFCFGMVYSQQEPQFTQYFDNTLFQNPAYAGSNKMLSINTMHREQWVGFKGRPSTTSMTIHSPLSYKSVGIGLSAVRDVIGPTTSNMVYADFSYSLRLTQNQTLAFGLKGGFNMINTQIAGLTTTTINDPNLAQNTLNRFNPNVGFGMYYHSDVLFLGLSSPKLLEQSIDGSAENLEKRHFYFNAGAILKLGTLWKTRPTAQIKSALGSPVSIDLSNAFIYRDKFFVGATYRHLAAVGVFFQYQLTQQIRMGIASDFATTSLRSYNQGTFEATLSYDFNFTKGGIRSPRYF